ncbi:hypothetical protein LTS10_011843 [Elasticomyces elasticus]|nr:hypothetical protein LTS10_011843 [Elasticomyces elasticus]
MPRPNPPPTPGSSSDIRGKEGVLGAPTFNLPPTAFQEPDRLSNSSSTPSVNGSDSSYRPVSPPSPADLSRKRPAAMQPVITKDDFALPPPPTRSRKIIQMKPKDNAGEQQQATPTQSTNVSPGKTSGGSGSQVGGKRKQNNNGATAAGRKIARKTAHSLIERRRRSKMNEEFGVLKDMIPACKGQEMHKLAILQASIEYLRYLEQCVSDLQAQNNSPRPQPPPLRRAMEEDDDDDEDEDMGDDDNDNEATASTPVTSALEHSNNSAISLPSLSQLTTTISNSPLTFSAGAGRHYSISSASQASYSPYFHSTHTSPAFGPQLSHMHSAPPYGGFGLGSPALRPLDSQGPIGSYSLRKVAEGAVELAGGQQANGRPTTRRSDHELDQEAAAALSMLNHQDRRSSWRTAGTGATGSSDGAGAAAGAGAGSGGMSVRDLLSG